MGTGFILCGYVARQVDGIKKFDHVRIAEKALGRPLPREAVVHHADEDRSNNANSNLVICPNRAYHNLLHRRLDALKACGDPNKRRCEVCKQFDDVSALRIYSRGRSSAAHHPGCWRALGRRRYAIRKEAA
jgi:hypothetical protein